MGETKDIEVLKITSADHDGKGGGGLCEEGGENGGEQSFPFSTTYHPYNAECFPDG